MAKIGCSSKVSKLGAVFYMKHVELAIDLWKKFIEKSGNEQNINMAAALLQKIGRGKKNVLSDRKFLDNLNWHEEGFGSGR